MRGDIRRLGKAGGGALGTKSGTCDPFPWTVSLMGIVNIGQSMESLRHHHATLLASERCTCASSMMVGACLRRSPSVHCTPTFHRTNAAPSRIVIEMAHVPNASTAPDGPPSRMTCENGIRTRAHRLGCACRRSRGAG